jgi:hypothetical protein
MNGKRALRLRASRRSRNAASRRTGIPRLDVAEVHSLAKRSQRVARWHELVGDIAAKAGSGDGAHHAIPLHFLGAVELVAAGNAAGVEVADPADVLLDGADQISFERAPDAWLCNMSLFGEMMPRHENRLTIDRGNADAWGIPVAHIDCTHSERDMRLVRQMREAGNDLADLTGMEPGDPNGRSWFKSLASSILRRKPAGIPPGSAIHETGGARMGTDPKRSVLNEHNQCWDCENVFVTDGACFPYAPFANPALTIMALTVRACDYILREYGPRLTR